MATHSSVLAWRIPGTGEPGGLPSMGSHKVGHDWSDLAAVAAARWGKDVEKLEPLRTVGGNVKWYSYCGKQYGGSSKKLKIELPYDPTIPFLGMYAEELKTGSQRDMCILVFTEALFTKTKMWQQLKYSLMDEWVKTICYIYNGILFSFNKEGNFVICYIHMNET